MTNASEAPTRAAANTDRELWREREGDYYADSIHVTESGGIGINCGGTVYVKPIREWHSLAALTVPDTYSQPQCKKSVKHGAAEYFCVLSEGHAGTCKTPLYALNALNAQQPPAPPYATWQEMEAQQAAAGPPRSMDYGNWPYGPAGDAPSAALQSILRAGLSHAEFLRAWRLVTEAVEKERSFYKIAEKSLAECESALASAREEIGRLRRAPELVRLESLSPVSARQAYDDGYATATALLKPDVERIDWLDKNPREATIRVGGDIKACVFYGVSCDPKWTVREAIDAAIAGAKQGEGNG